MYAAADNGLVQVNISVPDFEVEAAVGVGTYPGLIMHGSALASVV
jgi:hypothetical protein